MPPQKFPRAIGSKPYRVMFMPSVWYEKGSGNCRKRCLSALGLEGMKNYAFRIRRLVEVRRMTMPAKLVEELCTVELAHSGTGKSASPFRYNEDSVVSKRR